MASTQCTDNSNDASRNGCKRPSNDKLTEDDQESASKVAKVAVSTDVSSTRAMTPEKGTGAGEPPGSGRESLQDSNSDSDDEMERDKAGRL